MKRHLPLIAGCFFTFVLVAGLGIQRAYVVTQEERENEMNRDLAHEDVRLVGLIQAAEASGNAAEAARLRALREASAERIRRRVHELGR